jgi:hypothetical protein
MVSLSPGPKTSGISKRPSADGLVMVRFEKRLVLSAFWQAIPSHDQG